MPQRLQDYAAWTQQVLGYRKPAWILPTPPEEIAAIQGLPKVPPLPEEIANAQTALYQGIRDLAGRDQQAITSLMGSDHTALIFGGDPMIPVEQIVPLVHTARWAAGVLEEAGRAGVDVAQVLKDIPPPPIPDPSLYAARIKAVADVVLKANPNAAVSPPQELAQVDQTLLDSPPVSLSPIGQDSPLPDPSEILRDVGQHAPDAFAFTNDPVGAARRQQLVLSTLSHGQPFVAGYLISTTPQHLTDLDPRAIMVAVDQEGRILAYTQDPIRLDGTFEIDVSKGLSPLALPGKYRFHPSQAAPVSLRLDPQTEGLMVDSEKTAKLGWLQDRWKLAAHEPLTKGITAPTKDPLVFLSSLLSSPYNCRESPSHSSTD